jgi:hypothetical protein
VLTGTEQGVMEVGQGAGVRVGREIRHKPLLLRRTLSASSHLRAVAVQRDDVPAALIVAVVALGRVPGGGTEIVEVAGSPRRVVLVVARRRLGAGLVPTPGGVVAVGELGGRAIIVGVVAEGEDRSPDSVEQVSGGLIAPAGAASDIARSDQDRIAFGYLPQPHSGCKHHR